MQSQALRLKEEEENLAKKNMKTQFSERLLNPTAGTLRIYTYQNLLIYIFEKFVQ